MAGVAGDLIPASPRPPQVDWSSPSLSIAMRPPAGPARRRTGLLRVHRQVMDPVRRPAQDVDRVEGLSRLGALPRDVVAPDAVDLAGLERLHDRRLVEEDLRDELLDLHRPVRVPVVVEAVDDDFLSLRPRRELVRTGADDPHARRPDLVPVRLHEGLRGHRRGHGCEGIGEVRVGAVNVIVMSSGPVASTFLTRSWKVARKEPTSGSRCRFRLKATSSAVMSVPSWNFTPERSLITIVVGS